MPVSRRTFLSIGSGTLLLSIGVRRAQPWHGHDDAPLEPNQWVSIDPAGMVTVVTDKSEMGQGAVTALAAIVADELGADSERVRVVPAEPGPAFQDMGTGGSDSVEGRWRDLRRAAAAAREMLVTAAAASWGVPAGECSTSGGLVTHAPSSRTRPFGELVEAARALPVPAKPTPRPASEYRVIGTRIPRIDTREVVTGRKLYAADIRMPGMMHAVIARPPVPGGKLLRWSATRAQAIPGVRKVVEVPNGLAVLADTTWSAIQGRAALDASWAPGAGATIDSAGLWSSLGAALDRPGVVARREGDPAAAARGAASHLAAEYRYPFQAHAAIEPLNAVARISDGQAEIWVGIQQANHLQGEAARRLGIALDRVRVHVLPLGGGFGRRLTTDFALEAVDVARAAGVPVQLTWTREDDFQYDMHQSAAIVRMDAALDATGRVAGWSHRIADFHLSMFGDFDPATFKPAEDLEPWGGFDTPYGFPALSVVIARQSAPVRTGAWRSVFYPSSVFARECFLDEVAHAGRHDPVAFRESLLAAKPRLRAVLSLAADKSRWSAGPTTRVGRRSGLGVACNEYHGRTVVATVAEVSVGAGGDLKIHRLVVAIDCGRAVNVDGVEAQVEGGAAWALSTLLGRAITFKAGRSEATGFQHFPVLRMPRMPRVEIHIVPSDLPPSGVGEQPVPAVIPAVLNAVYTATGTRVRQIPWVVPPRR